MTSTLIDGAFETLERESRRRSSQWTCDRWDSNFNLPSFSIQGREDHITPLSLATTYFEKIKAPLKRMTIIDGAGHFAPMTLMQLLPAALREHVRLLPR